MSKKSLFGRLFRAFSAFRKIKFFKFKCGLIARLRSNDKRLFESNATDGNQVLAGPKNMRPA